MTPSGDHRPLTTARQVEERLVHTTHARPAMTDEHLDELLPPGDGLSEHLAAEVAHVFEHGPLEPGEPLDGCPCGECRTPGLPPYVDLRGVA